MTPFPRTNAGIFPIQLVTPNLPLVTPNLSLENAGIVFASRSMSTSEILASQEP